MAAALGCFAKEEASRAFSSRPFHGLDYFSNVKFVIQHAELELWTGPLMRHEGFGQANSPKGAPALLQDPTL
jgi:hypothetical protein